MPTCHNCDRVYEPNGITRHRMAHQRRGETVIVTMHSGTWEYPPLPAAQTDSASFADTNMSQSSPHAK